MFLTLKKRAVIAVLCFLLATIFVIVCLSAFQMTFQPKAEHVIVIDAGHGGIDNGASGKSTGVLESELNLAYAKTLKSLCEELGYGVVMTRKTGEGLYNPTATNKKRSDMEKRKAIIDGSDADIVVSVHMNSFPLTSSSGAQVFYAKGNEAGKQLADLVQSSIKKNFSNARQNASVGDYFILNCTQKPAILVEFGFLSNPQEEKNLQDKSYMRELCISVLSGVLAFLK